MQSLALVVHVLLAVGVIGLVLMQHGKGADAGAAFGSGASATVFGARGAASFLTRMTTALAVAFFLTSLLLFYLAAHRERGLQSVTDNVPAAEGEAPLQDQELPQAADPAGDEAAPTGQDDALPAPADESGSNESSEIGEPAGASPESDAPSVEAGSNGSGSENAPSEQSGQNATSESGSTSGADSAGNDGNSEPADADDEASLPAPADE